MGRKSREKKERKLVGEVANKDSNGYLIKSGKTWLVPSLIFTIITVCFVVVDFKKPKVKTSEEEKVYKGSAELPISTVFDEVGRHVLDGSWKGKDIQTLNLLCAKGLPGAENLNIDEYEEIIFKLGSRYFSEIIDQELIQKPENNIHNASFSQVLHQNSISNPFNSPNNSADLMKDLNDISLKLKREVQLSPVVESGQNFKENFENPNHLFIHGLLDKTHDNKNKSFPVLFATIGNMLDYPLMLAPAKGKMFIRHDDKREYTQRAFLLRPNHVRMNIDFFNGRVVSYPDEYYKYSPTPLTKREVESGEYIDSLSKADAFSAFLEIRAYCFAANGNKNMAKRTMAYALQVSPRFATRIQKRLLQFMQQEDFKVNEDYIAWAQTLHDEDLHQLNIEFIRDE